MRLFQNQCVGCGQLFNGRTHNARSCSKECKLAKDRENAARRRGTLNPASIENTRASLDNFIARRRERIAQNQRRMEVMR